MCSLTAVLLVYQILDLILLKFFKMRRIAGVDNCLLHSYRDPIVIGSLTTTKFEYEKMKVFLIDKMPRMPNMQDKVVERFGQHYFQPMAEAEWEMKRDKVVTRLDGIHTTQQLQEKYETIFRDSIDITNTVCYRWILIPDFSETESKMLFVFHHVAFDGVSAATLANLLQDKPDWTIFRHRVSREMSAIERLCCQLVAPLLLPKVLFDILYFDICARDNQFHAIGGHASDTRTCRELENVPLAPI